MKRKMVGVVIALLLALTLIPSMAFAGSTNACDDESCMHEAAIGDTHYDTLGEAIEATSEAIADETIDLLNFVECDIKIFNEEPNIKINLNGNMLVIDKVTDFKTAPEVKKCLADDTILIVDIVDFDEDGGNILEYRAVSVENNNPKMTAIDNMAAFRDKTNEGVYHIYNYIVDENDLERIGYAVTFIDTNPQGDIIPASLGYVVPLGSKIDSESILDIKEFEDFYGNSDELFIGSEDFEFAGWYTAEIGYKEDGDAYIEKYLEPLTEDIELTDDMEFFAAWKKVESGSAVDPEDNTGKDDASKPEAGKTEKTVQTSDDFNMTIPFALAGLAVVGMVAAVVVRRKHNC